MQEEIGYLRMKLAKRSRQLATKQERSDVLQREALGRIEALTAGTIVSEPDQEHAKIDSEAPCLVQESDPASMGLMGMVEAVVGRVGMRAERPQVDTIFRNAMAREEFFPGHWPFLADYVANRCHVT